MNKTKTYNIMLLLDTTIQIFIFILDDDDYEITEKSTTIPSAIEGSTPAKGINKQNKSIGI